MVLFKEAQPEAWRKHQELSLLAYRKSVTLVRDFNSVLPITKWLNPIPKSSTGDSGEDANNVLILTPLLNPLYTPAEVQDEPQLYVGEEVFKKFGELLSNHPFNSESKTPYNVLHTTYTANGLTALHESLIENSQVVIVLTSEASRNMYQIGIVKYISILCGANPYSFGSSGSHRTQLSKPLVIVATLSPYDFFYNKSIGSTYLCCYDYTDNVLEQLVGVLMGDVQAEGCIPGEKKYIAGGGKSKKRKLFESHSHLHGSLMMSKKAIKRNPTPKRRWLVDELNLQRDWAALLKLLKNNSNGELYRYSVAEEINLQDDSYYKMLYFLLRTTNHQKHFVVKNASLNILYGVVLTWIDENQYTPFGESPTATNTMIKGKVGSIAYLMVDKSKMGQSIGKNLHTRAMKYLIEEQGCQKITLGCSFPLIQFPNVKLLSDKVISFFHNVGWDLNTPKQGSRKHIMILENLSKWLVPKKIFRELMIVGVRFDICSNPEKLMNLINKSTKKIEEGEEEISETKKLEEELQESINIKTLYLEAIKHLDNNSSNGVKIIIALEPTNQNVIGSVILFNNRCQLAKFYPFMNQADGGIKDNTGNDNNGNINNNNADTASDHGPVIGGIIGPIIDPSYSNLTEIFKFGLVCSGITFLKSSNSENTANRMNQCIMIGIDEQKNSNINGIKDIGFKEWKYYYDFLDKKSDFTNFLK